MFNIRCNCFYNITRVGPDITFNKPAKANSAHLNNWISFGPQFVNNGKANCSNPIGPIALTPREPNPWFKVDLRGTFNIKLVEILPRPSKCLYLNLIFMFIK